MVLRYRRSPTHYTDGHHKFIVWSLITFFILSHVLWVRAYQPIFYYKFLPGCRVWSGVTSNPQCCVWFPLLAFEGILVLLTAYKLFPFRNQMNRTVIMLSRDSFLYFVIIGACLALTLASQVDQNINVDVLMRLPLRCAMSGLIR